VRLKLLSLLAVLVVLSGLLEMKRKPASKNHGDPPVIMAIEADSSEHQADTLKYSVQIAI
jgi:hypothetical protein